MRFRNIKNVKEGYVDFSECDNAKNGKFLDKAGILGIYGQNGSGKTTIVNAIGLLQFLARNRRLNTFDEKGNRVPSQFDYLLDLNENEGQIEFEFIINESDNPYLVKYILTLYHEEGSDINKISNECFSITPYFPNEKRKFKGEYAPLEFNYKVNSLSYLYDGIKHDSSNIKIKSSQISDYTLINSRKLSSIESGSSVVFSDEVGKYLINSQIIKVKKVGEVLKQFKIQLCFDLFVYDNKLDSLFEVGLGTLFGVYLDKENKLETHGSFKVSNFSFTIPENQKKMYDSFIEQINIFIKSFVPGFKAKINVISEQVDEDGKKLILVSIVRCIGNNKSEKELPLSEESAGIRKLFSITCAIVKVFGSSGSWLVVDEFDSGVFEKLLGQLLYVFQENGKGQILFTAHNLRPLERLDSNSIVFTTNNPNLRYIRFPKSLIKDGSNLRKLYLRALSVGGMEEELTSEVEDEEIEFALWKAVELSNSLKM